MRSAIIVYSCVTQIAFMLHIIKVWVNGANEGKAAKAQ